MIEVKELVKTYGAFRAVDGISFQVERGEVLGFLGPNGAGKSTTMRMITCFLPPTAGTVTVGGKDILKDSVGVREQIGYLPESAPSYPEMQVDEFLRFMAEVRGFTGADRNRHIDRVTELTSLSEVRDQVIDTLSKGFRQRVCFAQALLHDPPVLILDEPTDGLDPNQKHDMRDVIKRMAETKTVILSTHILEEMEAVCTRAIIIARGRLVADGSPEELAARSRYHNAVTFKLSKKGTDTMLKAIKALDGVADAVYVPTRGRGQATYQVIPKPGKKILQTVTSYLDSKKIQTEEVFTERGRVDEVFRELTQGVA